MSQNSPSLDSLSHSQQQRLAFIDFNLQYFGHIGRQDIINRFATGLAASTRDFSLYKELAPQNMVLNHGSKQYLRTSSFTPIFSHQTQAILTSLSQGFGDGLSVGVKPSSQCIDAIQLIHPQPDIIADLVRAMHNRYPVLTEYCSLNSGMRKRTIVPHTLINNGHRWHVRAYDCDNARFSDFVCTRFSSVEPVDRDLAHKELIENDLDWQSLVELTLIVHPEIKVTKAIEMDYGMTDGSVVLQVRAALAAYLLRYWQVDCSKEYRIRGQGCQLALANLSILDNIANAHLAPGWSAN